MEQLRNMTVDIGLYTDTSPLVEVNREINKFKRQTMGVGTEVNKMASTFKSATQEMIKESQAFNKQVTRQSDLIRKLARTSGMSAAHLAADWSSMSDEMRKSLIKNHNELMKHRKDLLLVKNDMRKLGAQMGHYTGTTDDFMAEIQRLGKQHKKISDQMINNNLSTRQSLIQTIATMSAMSGQLEKIVASYDRMGSSLLKVNKPLLAVTSGLERMARNGNAAALALRLLGPNAKMKELLDMQRMINQGTMRYQMVAIAALAAGALFYHGLHKAARDSVPGYAKAFDQMQASMRKAFQPMVDVFASVMVPVFKFIKYIADLTIKFNEAHPVLAKIIQGFLLLIPAVTLLLAPLAVGIGLFAGMQAAFASVWMLIGPLVTGLGAMMGTVLLVSAAVVGVGAAFYLAWKHSETFRNGVMNVITGFKAFLQMLKGNMGGGASMLTSLGMDPATIRGIMSFATTVRNVLISVKNGLNFVKEAAKGVFAIFTGNVGKGASILTSLGLSPETIRTVISTVTSIKSTMVAGLTAIWGFIKSIIQRIAVFWSQNGALILQAVKNVWTVIGTVIKTVMNVVWSIMKFIWPLVLALIKSVWGNIKGVINGALNIIMGLVKIFSGLFTGNFSKMWQGIKQLFSGAIQFIWNFIQLNMFGKVLGAGKAFVVGFKNVFVALWGGLKSLFMGGVRAIWNFLVKGFSGMKSASTSIFTGLKNAALGIWNTLRGGLSGLITRIVSGVKSAWTTAKNFTVNMFNNIKDAVKDRFTAIVDAAKALPGKIGQGIKNMAGKAMSGVKHLANALIGGLAQGVNGVTGGINWVLGKIGVDKRIPKWDPPQYAKGTDFHPGGPAIVGERGRELINANGQVFLANKKMMLNLPRGASVLTNKETERLLKAGYPGYANGVGNFLKDTWNGTKNLGRKAWDGTKHAAGAAWDGTKKVAGKVKDLGIDVWNYMSNPTKLMKLVFKKMGVGFPKMPGAFGTMGVGAINMLKDKAIGYVKKKMADLGGMFSGSKPSGNVAQWIRAAMAATGVPDSWFSPLVTIAMKESGGNPRAYNGWDINAKRGIASRGLMQTIPPTFEAYKLPGMNDIWNPVHNAVAAIRYIKARYGTVFNTPGIRSMAHGGPYRGYANGGIATKPQWATLAENGWKEFIIPTQPSKRKRALGLLEQANTELGYSPDRGGRGSGSVYSSSTGGANGNRSVSITYNPQVEIKVEGNVDPKTAHGLKQEFQKMLDDHYKKLLSQFNTGEVL